MSEEMNVQNLIIEGRNAVIEAFRSGKPIDKIFVLLQQITNHAYYVDMAVAWLISYAIVKFPEKTIDLLAQKKLTKFVQNKAICKCRDSFRVDKHVKEMLIEYRIK